MQCRMHKPKKLRHRTFMPGTKPCLMEKDTSLTCSMYSSSSSYVLTIPVVAEDDAPAPADAMGTFKIRCSNSFTVLVRIGRFGTLLPAACLFCDAQSTIYFVLVERAVVACPVQGLQCGGDMASHGISCRCAGSSRHIPAASHRRWASSCV